MREYNCVQCQKEFSHNNTFRGGRPPKKCQECANAKRTRETTVSKKQAPESPLESAKEVFV